MTRPEYDAVIAGGGLSGLSLAAHLATGGWQNRRVLVVDDASAGSADMSWASWSRRPGLLDRAMSRTFQQIRVFAAGTSRTVPLDPYRYGVVRRADLRRVVSAMVADRPGFALRTGRVQAIHDHGDGAVVTVDGRPVHCSWAFDSVTAAPPDPDPDAYLAFTGWEVRCAEPLFDPRTPTLFDFSVRSADTARFAYVLPDGPRRALVEITEFVPPRGSVPSLRARQAVLGEYLCRALRGRRYQRVRTESAVLPLRARPAERGAGRVLTIGARGGLIKASTGYAYQRIQRDSEAITRSLTRHGHPHDRPPTARRHRLLDAVLLEVLRRDPRQLETAFGRLFTANPAARVLRFLDEDTGPGEELRLVASLPPAPYLAAATARVTRRAARTPSRP
jgi:lycopene beta-cyclase